MEKLKNIISGGHKTDQAVTPDNTQSQNPVGSGNVPGSGQGSHFGSSRTGADQPLSSSINPTPSSTGTHGLREPHSSRMPGSFDDDAATTASVKSGIPGSSQAGDYASGQPQTLGHEGSQPLSSKTHPSSSGPMGTGAMSSSTGSGMKSGMGHDMNSGLGSDTNRTGVSTQPTNMGTTGTLHGSNVNPTSNTNTGLTGAGHDTAGTAEHGLHHSTGSSHLARDAALGTGALGAGSTATHHDRHANDSERSFPLAGSSTNAPNFSTPGQIGTYPAGGVASGRSAGEVGSHAGPHSSTLADRSLGSHANDSRGLGHSSDTSGVGSAMSSTPGHTGASTTGPHSSSLANKADPRIDSSSNRDYSQGTGTGAGFGSESGAGLGSGPGVGHHGTGTAGMTDPLNTHGTTGTHGSTLGQGSNYSGLGHSGSSQGLGGTAGSGSDYHHVPGPHITDTANRLDPHVGSGGSITGITAPPNTGTGHHLGRDAAVAGGAGALGAGAYGAERGHGSSGLPESISTSGRNDGAASSYSGPSSGTTGHNSTHNSSSKPSLMERLDPRKDTSKQGVEKDHHTGRDAGAMGAGGALGGAAAYEGAKHHGSSHGPTSTDSSYPSSTTHDNSGMTGAGYGQDSGVSRTGGHGHQGLGQGGATGSAFTREGTGHQGTYQDPRSTSASQPSGGMAGTSTHQPNTGLRDTAEHTPHQSQGHHYGRDAGGAGAAGVGAYEAEKHLHSGSSDPQERLAGSGHGLNTRSDPATQPGSTVAPGIGSTTSRDLPGQSSSLSDPYGSRHQGSSLGAATGSGNSAGYDRHPTAAASDTYTPEERLHHRERDAALGAAGGSGAAGFAAHEQHRGGQSGYNTQPNTSTSGAYPVEDRHHHTGRDAALGGTAASGATGLTAHEHGAGGHRGYDQQPLGTTSNAYASDDRHPHKGRDAALGAAAGTGAAGYAAHENNSNDASDLSGKEQRQELKQAHRHEKHHEKTMDKEDKKTEKAIAKEEKHHDKAIAAEEKKHDHASHDKTTEKKPGLIDRLLHRHHDEPVEETQRHEPVSGKHNDRTVSNLQDLGMDDARPTGHSTTHDMQHPTNSSTGAHDSHMGSGRTTHDAYGEGVGHNKLHKDPPAKVMEERGL